MSVGIISMKPIPKKINPYCCRLYAGAVIEAIVIPMYTIHHVANTVSISNFSITYFLVKIRSIDKWIIIPKIHIPKAML